MNSNPIEILRDIREQQRNLGKDIAGYAGILALCLTEVVRTNNMYFMPAAIGAGFMSFASCIAYDQCVTAGDGIVDQVIKEITAPC